jgi:hypothetical protein
VSSSALRPLRIGEILDAGIKAYLRNARTLLGLTALVVVPFQALAAVVLLSTVSNGDEIPHGSVLAVGHRSAAHATSVGANAVLGITSILVAAITTAACVKAVSDIYLDQPTSIRGSLSFALRRSLALIWLEILTGVLLVIAFIALVIPGIWLYGAWSVATQALLIERLGAASALGRSYALVRGRWWPTAGVLIVSQIMVSIVGGAIQALLVAIFLAGSSVLVTALVVSLAAAVSAILTRPLSAAIRTVLYYDLRVRREGFDVEMLADQLGLAPSAVAAAAVTPGSPESVGQPGGPPFWPPPPGWQPSLDAADGEPS